MTTIAEKAYRTWDDYGGKGLGTWGARLNGNYTTQAWIQVVRLVLTESGHDDELPDED
jgi:hypothetical protein